MNAMENDQKMQVKRDVRDVCMPMGLVYEALVKTGRLKYGQGKKEEMNQEKCSCQYHERTESHPILEYPEFLKLVQVMMNEGEIKFYEKIEEQNVSVC